MFFSFSKRYTKNKSWKIFANSKTIKSFYLRSHVNWKPACYITVEHNVYIKAVVVQIHERLQFCPPVATSTLFSGSNWQWVIPNIVSQFSQDVLDVTFFNKVGKCWNYFSEYSWTLYIFNSIRNSSIGISNKITELHSFWNTSRCRAKSFES